MNKVKVRVLGSVLIGLCFGLPKLSFIIQDYTNYNEAISIDGGKMEDILKKHPLISYLYQYDYVLNNEVEQERYIIKNSQSYSKKQQKSLKDIQDIYSEEIQKLINYKILTHSLLESDPQKDYQLTFGTLIKNKKQTIEQYALEQIYKLNSQHDKIIDFHMDAQTYKIMKISITKDDVQQINQDEMKTLLWNMIQYLELDDIDDWHYNQNGYESYQAKLRVSFENTVIDGQQTYSIRTSILYSAFQKQVHIIVE